MSNDHLNGNEIIAKWYFQDWIGDSSHLPGSEDIFNFLKIVIDIISAYGELSEQERIYILGRAAILGATEDVLDKIKKYESNLSGDINKLNQEFGLPHVQKARMGIIHNLFQMLRINNTLNSEEIDGIYSIGKKLGATEEQIQQVHDLFDEEEKLRQKRALLLFPQGFGDTLKVYQKLH